MIVICIIGLLLIPNLAINIEASTIKVDNIGSTEKKDWTIIVYMCGDNDLEHNIEKSLNWLEWTGTNEDINIVAQVDYYTEFLNIVKRYEIQYDTNYDNLYDYTKNVNMWELDEQNTGDPQTLINFAKWSIDNYPAERYCLILWGHGNGWQGFLRDDTPLDDLKMDEFKQAMTSIKNHIGKKIDIVSFETCLLSMIEVYYQIRGTVDICVGSEDFVYGSGFPYHMIYPDLKENPQMSTEELAINIIDAYENYHSSSSMALGAFYADKIEELVEGEFLIFAQKLTEYHSIFKERFNEAIGDTESFDIEPYIITHFKDLYDFAYEVKYQMRYVGVENKDKADEMELLAQDLMNSIEDATIYTVENKKSDAKGLSIYIPNNRNNYDTRYKNIDLCIYTKWDNFIDLHLPRTIYLRTMLSNFQILQKLFNRFTSLFC